MVLNDWNRRAAGGYHGSNHLHDNSSRASAGL
jgi:hypothetical protein